MELLKLELPGCYEIRFGAHRDDRGEFVKTYQQSSFAQLGLESDFSETFYTVSNQDVVRGMHFQAPPADHAKLVYCISGAVQDIALDIREGSPTYGRHVVVELEAELRNGIYLSRGIAHGFAVRNAPAVLMYCVSSEYAPGLDCGIRWDSFGAEWPVSAPVVSARDRRLPRFGDFETPFACVSETAEVLP